MTVPCSQVLMGLNFSQLTCHFTSTANLTACQLPATRWHAYTRATDASTAAAFDVSAGFLGAGDDARAPAELSVAGCEAACVGLASCRGFTFQAGGARAVVGLACIPRSQHHHDTHLTCAYPPWHSDVRVPTLALQAESARPAGQVKCHFKTAIRLTAEKDDCVAPGGEGKPACSPLPGEMGLGGYYGHYQGHWLSATAFLVNATGNATVAAAAERVIEVYAAVMEAWRAKYGDAEDGYLFPYDPIVWDKLLAGHGAGPYYSARLTRPSPNPNPNPNSDPNPNPNPNPDPNQVPFYTLHKLMAGLLDQHTHAGSSLAYALLTRMAAWVGLWQRT